MGARVGGIMGARVGGKMGARVGVKMGARVGEILQFTHFKLYFISFYYNIYYITKSTSTKS